MVAKGKVKGCGEVTEIGQSADPVRPHGRRATPSGPGRERPGERRPRPARPSCNPGRGLGSSAQPPAPLPLGLREVSGSHLQSRTRGSTVPKTTTSWPREGSRGREGVAAGQKGGRRAPLPGRAGQREWGRGASGTAPTGLPSSPPPPGFVVMKPAGEERSRIKGN